MKLSKLIFALSLGAIASLCSGIADATPAAPPTSPLSDRFAIYNPDGSLLQSLSIYEDGSTWLIDPAFGAVPYPFGSGEDLTCPGTYCYSIGWEFANPALAGPNPQLVLLEGPNFQLSDYLGVYIDQCCANGSFYFASDANGGLESPFHFNIGCVVLGNVCDITDFLLPAAIEAGYSATFFSDGDIRVPEPLTLSLFGAGLAGAVAMRRRKRKTV